MAGSRWQILNANDLQALKPIFKHNGMNKLTEFSFRVLEAQDAYFAKSIYINSLGQFMKARGLAEATEDAVKYATDRAQILTFRDKSHLATIINNAKKIPGIGLFVETAVPFVKTPINITKRAIEYSFGLIKMATNKGKQGRRLGEDIAKVIMGSAIMGIGMLSLLKLARTEREKNKKRSFERLWVNRQIQ